MHSQFLEIYQPRTVSHHGVWKLGPLQMKIYGILARGKQITDNMLSHAELFLNEEVLPLVLTEGEDNGLGFVIVHPGTLGITIAAHWWIQGSVLCQHIHRQLYNAQEPMNTLARPAVACVWELAIINAENEAWKKMMMTAEPDHASYLAHFALSDVTE